jgi:hypothetical protein
VSIDDRSLAACSVSLRKRDLTNRQCRLLAAKASVRWDAAISPESGVEPTCQGHCSSDTFDSDSDIAVAATAARIDEPDLGSRGLRPFVIDPCCLSHKRGGPSSMRAIDPSAASGCPLHVAGSPGASNHARPRCHSARNQLSRDRQVMPRGGIMHLQSQSSTGLCPDSTFKY